ncbi:hypothetical protein YPPY63_3255, partial [Yersinia pestis PY-63]|jgi:hypothetical protein
MSKN